MKYISTLIILFLCYSVFGQIDKQPAKEIDTSQIYSFTEKPAEYPHKKDEVTELNKFIQAHIQYKEMKATGEQINGRVLVKFTIDIDGSVINPVVLRSLSAAADSEALRVVKLLKFIPGEQNGKLVRCYFNMPVSFIQ